MTKPIPCALCGNKSLVVKFDECSGLFVVCCTARCGMSTTGENCSTEEEAVDQWNTAIAGVQRAEIRRQNAEIGRQRMEIASLHFALTRVDTELGRLRASLHLPKPNKAHDDTLGR